MKLERRWIFGLATLLLLVAITWTAYGQGPTVRTTWEYKIVYDPNGDRLAEQRIASYGNEGWELVNAQKSDQSSELMFFFKRRR